MEISKGVLAGAPGRSLSREAWVRSHWCPVIRLEQRFPCRKEERQRILRKHRDFTQEDSDQRRQEGKPERGRQTAEIGVGEAEGRCGRALA